MVIGGKKIAQNILDELKKLPKPDKMLAAILIGNNAQSQSFLRQKEMIAAELGISFHLYQFSDSVLEEDLIKEIKRLGEDPEVGGIIVQLPLPRHYDRDRILAVINPQKDIDAITLKSRQWVFPLPVNVVRDILRIANYKLRDKIVAVVGRGFLVGQPIINWLAGQGCKKLIVFNSKSSLSEIKKADLVITGVGKGSLITPEMLKSGAAVIDFGYDVIEIRNEKGETKKKILGDFDSSSLQAKSHKLKAPLWYTPTPGGTGPILVAEIFRNFYKLNSS